MKIFIVDDDPIYRLIASKTLRVINPNLNIIEHENGELSLHDLKSQNILDEKIVVFLDINMPVMNGWELLENLEKNNFFNLTDLNIYMVSSSVDKNDVLKAKSFSFVKDFISKPLEVDTLKQILDKP